MNILNLSHATRHTSFPGLCLFTLFLLLPSLSSAQYLNQRTDCSVAFEEERKEIHDPLQHKDLTMNIMYDASANNGSPRGNRREAKDLKKTKNSKRADYITIDKYASKDSILNLPPGYGDITIECLLKAVAKVSEKSDPQITEAELKFLSNSTSNRKVYGSDTTEWSAYPTELGHVTFSLDNKPGKNLCKYAKFEYTLRKEVKRDGEIVQRDESAHIVTIKCNYTMEFQGKKIIIKINSISGSFS